MTSKQSNNQEITQPLSNQLQSSELQQKHALQFQNLKNQQDQESFQLLKKMPNKQQLLEQQQRHKLELKQQQFQQFQELLLLLTCPPPQQTKKGKIRPFKYSRLACDSCNKGRQACVMKEGAAFCNRCIDKKSKCTFDRTIKKRGRKPKENSDNRNGHQCCYSGSEPLANGRDLHEGSECFLSSVTIRTKVII
ncbi:10128_t:CDS:2 [Entrophospora sp. SA101]|nr:10128_t:CDS:2 [Entrophospora sp. SA101]